MEAAAPIFLRPLPLAHLSLYSNPTKFSSSSRARLFRLAAADDTNRSSISSSEEASPPFDDGVEIRFRRGSRRRYKEDVDGGGRAVEEEKKKPKTWEEMSINEKAVELYVGEKGLLFWLNKFAYASIFIMIGVWILFRFAGPALNLYQLDTPPLAPTSVFKGSS
uniref:Uncharacterized protein n=1 Tax=Kalanchoe fedtschenkoi TaxID=63787 RepID=A0A7N0UGM1_KALFE